MKMYANLHTHSTHSDGVFTPEEMVIIAKKEGYKAIAITDHDTATAYPYLKAECDKEDMECIFGVEFSVQEPGDFHIIGFNFDPEYPEMKKYLEDMAIRQTDNTKKCFDLAVEKGNISGVTWNEVLEFNKTVKWLCNNHVFNTMKAKGLVKQSEYRAWFDLNYGDNRFIFPPSIKFKTLYEIINLIKAAGGFAVWAHPCCTASGLEHFEMMLEAGIEGIEVWHHSASDEKRREIYDLAIKHGLFISGGSDHSGLCGGYYDSYPTKEAMMASYHYIPELSTGTTEEHFREIQSGRISRRRR